MLKIHDAKRWKKNTECSIPSTEIPSFDKLLITSLGLEFAVLLIIHFDIQTWTVAFNMKYESIFARQENEKYSKKSNLNQTADKSTRAVIQTFSVSNSNSNFFCSSDKITIITAFVSPCVRLSESVSVYYVLVAQIQTRAPVHTFRTSIFLLKTMDQKNGIRK